MTAATRPVRTDRLAAGALAGLLIGMLLVVVPPAPAARANHGPFPVSAGVYRIPYADGTQLTVTFDHHDHGGPNGNRDRIDMRADAPAPGTVVAAASGIIRAVVDNHGNSNGLGDGVDINGNAQDDTLEHSCQDAQDMNGNSIPNSVVTGLCQNYNNYVWIEHPNGEWSKYTHFATRSASQAPGFWSVGDTVLVGQVLGIESDVGRAGGRHLHHEIAVPNNPNDPTPFSDPTGDGRFLGGFIQGTNLVPFVCDIGAPNLYVKNAVYTASPCTNTAPTADAGGPYSVDEGSTIQLDGTASSDPENAILTYTWSPGSNLDDPTSPTPVYTAVDDTVDLIQLTVSDIGGDVTAATALTDTDVAIVTVNNVAPTVTAVGDAIDEGEAATVSATFTDPGTLDTHTATIDWDDGTPPQAVTVAQLAGGVARVYGDNGVFQVTVTVTDDDGGAGTDTVAVVVGNLDPVLSLDVADVVAFPGGDYAVVGAGAALPASAAGTDAGSDDLTFTWSTGDSSTSFNDGIGPDPFPSPLGTFPFMAEDAIGAVYASPGVETLAVTLSDDDGGADSGDAGVVVTGTATTTEGSGWWKHQYSGAGNPHVDPATASGYLEIVNAVSSVFSEAVAATTDADAHAVLSPSGGDRRARATAALLVAWLQFASGAVAWDATVPLPGGPAVAFLDLMSAAEATILDAGTSAGELLALEQDLDRVRHAG
jgi:hypothetical protein